MKSIKNVRLIAVILAILTLLAALTACADAGESGGTEAPAGSDSGSGDGAETLPVLWATATHTEDKAFGEGAKTVKVEVIADGYSVTFTVKTDEEFLGTPLLAHGIVTGDAGDYGLYITAVNGIPADYSVNQSWWGVSKDGEMLMTGVDSTKIEDGAHYELTYKIG